MKSTSSRFQHNFLKATESIESHHDMVSPHNDGLSQFRVRRCAFTPQKLQNSWPVWAAQTKILCCELLKHEGDMISHPICPHFPLATNCFIFTWICEKPGVATRIYHNLSKFVQNLVYFTKKGAAPKNHPDASSSDAENRLLDAKRRLLDASP